MSCCGGKRAQLSQMRPAPPAPEHPELPAEPVGRERKARMFEYVGRDSLTVRGAVSGRAYRFERAGDRVEVDYDDTFAMMAERDVRPAVREPTGNVHRGDRRG